LEKKVTLDLQTIGFAAVAATLSVLIIVPLTTVVPFQIREEWRREQAESAYALSQPLHPEEFEISVRWKTAIAASGAGTGLVAAAAHGFSTAAAALGLYFLGLVLLAAINLKHSLLPDKIVQMLLWAGLLNSTLSGHGSEHIYGAAVGYTAPFFLLLVGKAATGKELIGYGDLKAFAMAGAWLGLSSLPFVFGAFVAGIVLTLVGAAVFRRVAGWIPTGPAHLFASLAYATSERIF